MDSETSTAAPITVATVYELDWERAGHEHVFTLHIGEREVDDVIQADWTASYYEPIWSGDVVALIAKVRDVEPAKVAELLATPVAALEALFWIFNHQPEHLHWNGGCAASCPAKGHRSLSVGDIVVFTTGGQDQAWLCRSVGWTPIELPATVPA